MTPYLKPEQIDALVAKLLKNRPGGPRGTERKEIKEWLERPVGDLNPEAPGRPGRELLTDPHGSRERLRNLFIEIARQRNPAIDARLLGLWPADKPLTVVVKDAVKTSLVLNRKLKTWARRWHLNEPWVIERARNVLRRRQELLVEMHFDKPAPWVTPDVLYWLDEAWGFDAVVTEIEPGMAAALIAATDTAQRAPSVATQRTFNPPVPEAWHPNVRTEAQYRLYIDGYIKWIRDQVDALGWIKPLEKHEPLHFEWLVRFQIEGEGYSAIARNLPAEYEHSRDRQLVHKAVKALANDISLTLRS
jgi:hypothetical protein